MIIQPHKLNSYIIINYISFMLLNLIIFNKCLMLYTSWVIGSPKFRRDIRTS